MKPCECDNDNYICHSADGCVCKQGFTGENCALFQKFLIADQGGSGVVVAVIIVSIIFVAVVVLVIFYYRRRVSNLKTEIAHVQYIADPSAFSTGENILSFLWIN